MTHGAIRDEARLLVTGVLAAASRAAEGWPGHPDCRCPVCRAAATVRTPDPATAERVADAVGVAAAGVADLLRTLSGDGPSRPTPDPATASDSTASDGSGSDGTASGGTAAGGGGSDGSAPGGTEPGDGEESAAGGTVPAARGEQTKGDVGCH